jgi:hypothetical protein
LVQEEVKFPPGSFATQPFQNDACRESACRSAGSRL